MQEIVRVMSDYPLAAIGVAFVVVVIFFFFFMKLVKTALVLLLITVAVGGYFYLRYPDDRPANLSEALEKARTGTGRALDKGKETISKGRELIDKGKEMYEKGKELVDKGKETLGKGVDKGKDATDEIGKIIGGEKESGRR
ncbi:MAG TPA: hypothetical protein DCZ97_08785 [Syntrophus sp. (in: bacteria)]|nr:hypothetical protein [Syntrophus sp. (in: bacteria)]